MRVKNLKFVSLPVPEIIGEKDEKEEDGNYREMNERERNIR